MSEKIAIIGSGLSGMACAIELKRNNFNPIIFEASSDIGGRVKTDNVDGFLLDHGFQVYLPSYKMGQYYLDYKKLELKHFSPGSYIFNKDRFHLISDPLREPTRILSTAFTSLASIKDKMLTLKLMFNTNIDYDNIKTTQTAIEYLNKFGFSKSYINNFFIPFFSGVFLTKDLNVPADYFKFLFNTFKNSYASLPKKGMAQIPKQMALEIGLNNINCGQKLSAEELLNKGYTHVFVAHENSNYQEKDIDFLSVKTEYYKTKSKKWSSKTLYLNSDKKSVVNHVACLSAVNNHYSPKDWQLFSVNILGNAKDSSKPDLIKLFGDEEIKNWEHIKTYNIKKALPAKASYGFYKENNMPNISFCGDYLESPSIQGALYSGRKAARKYLNRLQN